MHILDFLTREPDLYSTVLPLEWREWFELRDVSSILDFLLREDIPILESFRDIDHAVDGGYSEVGHDMAYNDGFRPPQSLLDYVVTIRKHSLRRDFGDLCENDTAPTVLPRHIAVGMKPKKIHEVQNFARYINDLSTDITSSGARDVTHIVDFGSGQNYLGRTLASPPYNKHVVALESKLHNINGARSMDITAKLAEKDVVLRNKKEHRNGQQIRVQFKTNDTKQALTTEDDFVLGETTRNSFYSGAWSQEEAGSIQYIQTIIENGDLSKIVGPIQHNSSNSARSEPLLMVVSLHSCGNLLHHGLRSLLINRSVKAVAMVGCCYNLVTERLGPPTFKLPSLRTSNLRLEQMSSTCDPHGFPMSNRLSEYSYRYGKGIRMNITARMMACQAPQNWTAMEYGSFFTRHFYRALLQRIFLDRGVVGMPCEKLAETGGDSPKGLTGAGPAIIIGSLRKTCYTSFTAYVRGAVQKLCNDSSHGRRIRESMRGLTDEDILAYEEKYGGKKKDLSVIWSLMAFSASVVESVIVSDRWLYLKEQRAVRDCWVEPVFEYSQSPRNLVVVGIKQ